MKIKGIDSMTLYEVQEEVANGGKFVVYSFCISFIVMSFKKTSAVYFVRGNENAFARGLPFMAISFLFGWWGLPWGIFYTIGCLFSCINGGKDVTDEVMQYLQRATSGHVFEFEPVTALAY